MPPKRLEYLDYLRGLSALCIMLYHYGAWSFGDFPTDSIMSRIGFYGVSIFYILSGLTLFYVYYEKMSLDFSKVTDFFVKRIFRIFPLLWLVSFATIVVHNKEVGIRGLILNLTGLFGFLRWDGYISTGAWSIGNELVFYVFFPFFVWFSKSNKWLMIVLSVVIAGLFTYFAFVKIPYAESFALKWTNYVNPLNQVFLFLAGFLIGLFFKDVSFSRKNVVLLFIISALIFCFYPVDGDRFNLVTGFNRIIFSFTCIVACLAFFKMSIPMPNLLNKALIFLGEASYSLYLLHPIVYYTLKKHITDVVILLAVSIPLSIICSYVVYIYFEKYFMRMGRKVADRLIVKKK